ncbi:MAG: ATP-binding cassette domain-containing protein [Thermodesulfobacteriota bacterium]|nr:ATP-binding cassette domain-containing protein [Thermodesulfobacteriota bacterium]
MIAFHAVNIQKSFVQRLVLDLDLHFEEAQLHVILGPNGSGKTSLLRLLALLDEPDRGEVLLKENGQSLTKDHNTRQRIVLVPRPDGLFNHTVSRNVAYGLKLRKMAKVQRSELIHEALEAVGLLHLRQANALTLSSGEKQRLCLAMAMAVKPDVVLLDEPTSSLDPHNIIQVEKIIGRMKEEARMIILVTHNISQARRLADMVTFMGEDNTVFQSVAADFFSTSRGNGLDGYL